MCSITVLYEMQLSVKSARCFENHSRLIMKKHFVVKFSNYGRLFIAIRSCDSRSEMPVLNSTDLHVSNISIPLFDRKNEVDIANRQWPLRQRIVVDFPQTQTISRFFQVLHYDFVLECLIQQRSYLDWSILQ
jgi:hypothetical protein